MTMLAILSLLLPADEAALRAAVETAKDAAARVEALRKLAGAKEETSIDLLVKSLKDPEKDVRKAAVEALETAEDAKGKAVAPLGAVLNGKAEDLEVRLGAAKALAKAQFKAGALEAMITCICSISNAERGLHKFGGDVTRLLNKLSGQDFGVGKQTPMLWEQWWADNKEKLRQEDEKKRSGK